jgi:hypothetical protein
MPDACALYWMLHNKQAKFFSGPIAQWLEQETHNFLVGGSNPSGPIETSHSKAFYAL